MNISKKIISLRSFSPFPLWDKSCFIVAQDYLLNGHESHRSKSPSTVARINRHQSEYLHRQANGVWMSSEFRKENGFISLKERSILNAKEGLDYLVEKLQKLSGKFDFIFILANETDAHVFNIRSEKGFGSIDDTLYIHDVLSREDARVRGKSCEEYSFNYSREGVERGFIDKLERKIDGFIAEFGSKINSEIKVQVMFPYKKGSSPKLEAEQIKLTQVQVGFEEFKL